ncbi:MAG: universal stress protein [Bacteroidota bacterium]
MTSPFNRILVGLDMSQTDKHLLTYIQKQCFIGDNDQLYLLHVVPTLVSPKFIIETSGIEPTFPLDEKLAGQIADSLVDNLSKGSIQIGIQEGSVTSKLLHWEEVKQAKLTFLGKKSSEAGSGVNALRFIRKSKSSVWFIPEDFQRETKKVVIATDFSDHSTGGIQKAIDMCKAYVVKPSITFLNVVHAPTDMVYRLDKTYTQFSAELVKTVEEYFPTYLEKFDLEGISYETAVIEDNQFDIPKHLLDFVGEKEADLLVLGAQGHSALESFLLGSVAEKTIMKNEKVPLLIVR